MVGVHQQPVFKRLGDDSCCWGEFPMPDLD
jgi:hypothetical protein